VRFNSKRSEHEFDINVLYAFLPAGEIAPVVTLVLYDKWRCHQSQLKNSEIDAAGAASVHWPMTSYQLIEKGDIIIFLDKKIRPWYRGGDSFEQRYVTDAARVIRISKQTVSCGYVILSCLLRHLVRI